MNKYILTIICLFCAPYWSQAQRMCLDINADNIFHGQDNFGLGNYEGFIIGESHGAPGHDPLKLALIKYLNKEQGVTDIFLEIGNAAAWLYNSYLETGDTLYITNPRLAVGITPESMTFWKDLYQYNKQLKKKLVIRGLDFERTEYLKVMRLLMPEGKEKPEPIKEMLTTAEETKVKHLWYKWNGYNKHKILVANNRRYCKDYFGDNYPLLEKIMFNRNTYSNYSGRDSNMKHNLVEQVREHAVSKFVYIVGLIHQDTVSHRSFAWYLQTDTSFKMRTVRITPCYKDKNKEEYRYLISRYKYEQNVELLQPLFNKHALPGCDYTIVPAALVDNADLKSRGDLFVLTHVPWPEKPKKRLRLFRRH